MGIEKKKKEKKEKKEKKRKERIITIGEMETVVRKLQERYRRHGFIGYCIN